MGLDLEITTHILNARSATHGLKNVQVFLLFKAKAVPYVLQWLITVMRSMWPD